MANSRDPGRLASELLRQDEPLSDSEYQAYRRKLETALTTAERREKLVGRIAVASFIISFTLMFVGGSRVLGDFDPWSKNANIVSVTAGTVYILAIVLFFLSLASYYSRFRPGVREARERLRDATILDLQRQIRELRELAERNAPPEEPKSDQPNSG
jgi:hypothetical protein